MKIPERWKRAFRLALLTILLALLFIMNKYQFGFSLKIYFQSEPVKEETPANPALRVLILEDLIARHGNKPASDLYVPAP